MWLENRYTRYEFNNESDSNAKCEWELRWIRLATEWVCIGVCVRTCTVATKWWSLNDDSFDASERIITFKWITNPQSLCSVPKQCPIYPASMCGVYAHFKCFNIKAVLSIPPNAWSEFDFFFCILYRWRKKIHFMRISVCVCMCVSVCVRACVVVYVFLAKHEPSHPNNTHTHSDIHRQHVPRAFAYSNTYSHRHTRSQSRSYALTLRLSWLK